MTLRIVVADDHQVVLDGIRRALEGQQDIRIVGETSSGSHVLPLVSRTQPDLVLMDVHMPGRDGLSCLEQIRARHPQVKVVMLSASDDPDLIARVLTAGACAYIVKSVNPRDIPSALRQAAEGTVYHALGLLAGRRADPVEQSGLTARELTILEAVARGLTTKAISQEFWVTEQTVKFHLGNIYRKLGVSNRAGALRYAYEHGLVEAAASAA